MDFLKSLAGMAELTLTGADIPASLDILTQNQITVFSAITESDVSVRLVIFRRDWKKAVSLLQKRGDSVKLRRRQGLYWLFKGLIHRPVLVLGCAVLLAASLYVPGRIFFVRVEGNGVIPVNQILEAADLCGIRFGASRREVRSERMKNQLLHAMPQLQWAGVNTYGCVAVITVKERADPEQEQKFSQVGNIVAARDGIILTCTATNGSLLCKPGQAVREGEVLISGFTDCGLCIRAALASGEVFALTQRRLTAVMPAQYEKILSTGLQQKKYSLIIGKNRINFWKDSGICDTTCGRMYKEYYMTLPGGFQLPIALAVEVRTEYVTESQTASGDEWAAMLSAFGQRYLKNRMVAGNVVMPQETFRTEDGVFLLEGSYICTEMIGRVRQEQIGEYNGENN